MAAERECGGCTLCCKIMKIEALSKPAGQWCEHCRAGIGCSIYVDRPSECRQFMCGWLTTPSLADSLRPDKSKVVLFSERNGQGRRIVAACDPGYPTAWQREPVISYLRQCAADGWGRGTQVIATVGRRVWAFTPDGETDLGVLNPGYAYALDIGPDGKPVFRVFPVETESEPKRPA